MQRTAAGRMSIQEWATLPEDQPGELYDGVLEDEEVGAASGHAWSSVLDRWVKSSMISEQRGTTAASPGIAIAAGSNSSSNDRGIVQPPGAWLTTTATTGDNFAAGRFLRCRFQICTW